MRFSKIFTLCCLALLMTACANRDAAELGSLIGRSLGRPIGAVLTAADETIQTAGEVVRENPRYRQQRETKKSSARQEDESTDGDNGGEYYYRTEVLVRTRGPAQIDSLALLKAEDVSGFWK